MPFRQFNAWGWKRLFASKRLIVANVAILSIPALLLIDHSNVLDAVMIPLAIADDKEQASGILCAL